jgi:hypothetical protein
MYVCLGHCCLAVPPLVKDWLTDLDDTANNDVRAMTKIAELSPLCIEHSSTTIN